MSGSLLGASWGASEASQRRLGGVLGRVECNLGRIRSVLEMSWISCRFSKRALADSKVSYPGGFFVASLRSLFSVEDFLETISHLVRIFEGVEPVSDASLYCISK